MLLLLVAYRGGGKMIRAKVLMSVQGTRSEQHSVEQCRRKNQPRTRSHIGQ